MTDEVLNQWETLLQKKIFNLIDSIHDPNSSAKIARAFIESVYEMNHEEINLAIAEVWLGRRKSFYKYQEMDSK